KGGLIMRGSHRLHWSQRQPNRDQQSILGVRGLNRATMQFHGTVSDGKAETCAAAGAITGLTHAIKRLEDVLQITLGNTWAVVADAKLGGVQLPVQSNFHGGARGSVANAIADNVLNRAAQKFS